MAVGDFKMAKDGPEGEQPMFFGNAQIPIKWTMANKEILQQENSAMFNSADDATKQHSLGRLCSICNSLVWYGINSLLLDKIYAEGIFVFLKQCMTLSHIPGNTEIDSFISVLVDTIYDIVGRIGIKLYHYTGCSSISVNSCLASPVSSTDKEKSISNKTKFDMLDI